MNCFKCSKYCCPLNNANKSNNHRCISAVKMLKNVEYMENNKIISKRG